MHATCGVHKMTQQASKLHRVQSVEGAYDLGYCWIGLQVKHVHPGVVCIAWHGKVGLQAGYQDYKICRRNESGGRHV